MDSYAYTTPISSNVVVAMGSTSTQGFYFDYYGNLVTLFGTEFNNPPGIKTNDTTENRNHLLSFLNYLYEFVHEDKKVIFVNSIGYSIDGGKKKGDSIGIPYSFVDDVGYSGAGYFSHHTDHIFDVTDTSTHKCIFSTECLDSSVTIWMMSLKFTRLGDT